MIPLNKEKAFQTIEALKEQGYTLVNLEPYKENKFFATLICGDVEVYVEIASAPSFSNLLRERCSECGAKEELCCNCNAPTVIDEPIDSEYMAWLGFQK